MRGLRRDVSTATVPRWVYFAVALGLAAAVGIVVIGVREQHGRRIGEVSSASVTKVGGVSRPASVGPVQVGRAEAKRLNGLPQFPSGEMHCPAMDGMAYLVHFAIDSGAAVNVTVEVHGCANVDARTGGQVWGWDKWDRYGSARAEIARDLRIADQGQ